MFLNFRFWCIVLSRAGLLKIVEPETLGQSLILVARIIDGRPSLLLRLRLRLLVVFGEGI